MGTAMISNRISWFFDLKGPSISLDTACSSSLVALHLAVQSIRSREKALVGATNLILMPDTSNHLSTLTFLSPDAKSKAFDADGVYTPATLTSRLMHSTHPLDQIWRASQTSTR